ncbi:MAG TPA: hypothetical protein PKH32_12180, partial [Verrucomicrobiota bacterium]|nr:hypothetical protein [Verrucomicrobiota bacterium]
INHDGQGNLRGYAYGANIGWIHFDDLGGARVDLKTGNLSGFIYSANCGWISLSNTSACVQTDILQPGIDSDGDGIADAWELSHTNSLAVFTATSDTDGDGATDLNEHGADTNPLDPNDLLRVTEYSVAFGPGEGTDTITWLSKPTRFYVVQSRSNLNAGAAWLDATSLLAPDAGPQTTAVIPFGPASSERYLRVQALKPLAP